MTTEERLALLYSDGSITVLKPGSDIGAARRDRKFVSGLTSTKIATVQVEVLDILDDPAKPTPKDDVCPHCGKGMS